MNDEIERQNAEPNPEQRPAVPPKAAPTKSRGKKIAHSLVVASAVAVMSVYAAGYAATQSAASQIAAQATPAAFVQTATSTRNARATSTPTATSTSSGTAAASTYKDGTYTGAGTSRHGSIQATVVIQNGRIASAQITGATTRYPTSRISSLPGQVVSTQSTKVNYISGATDSSVAFLSAVSTALAKAA